MSQSGYCRRAVLATLALLPLVVGCGRPPTANVSGKVTVKGKDPLPGGNITFYHATDPTRVAGGAIKSDGTFTVNGAPVGECKVVIDNSNLDTSKNTGTAAPGGPIPGGGGGPPPEAKGRMSGPPKGADVPTGMGGGDTGTRRYVKLEASYGKAESTPLKHTVNLGDNKDVNFDVK